MSSLEKYVEKVKKETEDEILQILTRLAHDENKCVIIVTHSKNVAEIVDVCYELKKNDK